MCALRFSDFWVLEVVNPGINIAVWRDSQPDSTDGSALVPRNETLYLQYDDSRTFKANGIIEMDESMFGGRRPRKHGWGAGGKVLVLGPLWDKYNVQIHDNSVAIVGWEEWTVGQIHSWLEKTGKYHIACFINSTDKPIDINSNKIERDASQFAYSTKTGFKDKLLVNSANWI